MTHRYIAFHAAERPDATAVVEDGRAIDYRRFHRDIARTAAALAELGLRRDSCVAVDCKSLYFHWLLLLACERLGVATASIKPEDAGERGPVFANFDLILSEQRHAWEAQPRRQLTIAREWIESILAGEEAPVPAEAARHDAERIRLGHTSGTTGAVKTIVYSRRVFDRLIEKWIWRCCLSRECRYLLALPFTVEGAYHHATACIRAGGTVVIESGVCDIAASLSRHDITQVTLFPIQLEQILERLPAGYIKPRNLAISTLGAAVSPALRADATARLASWLYETYGCNEIGFISSTGDGDEGRRGALCPGVEVEIVDERDRPLAIGETGRIRVRTDTMVDGYLGDPAATERMFRNGWFYPGDLGMLLSPRRLAVMARQDELLNLGGIKVPPAQIEAAIAAHAPVADVGVCEIANGLGAKELWIAVSGARCADEALPQEVGEALRSIPLGTFRIAKLASIPRTATGKIRRDALREALAELLRRAAGE